MDLSQSTCIMVKGNELMTYFIYWPLFVQSVNHKRASLQFQEWQPTWHKVFLIFSNTIHWYCLTDLSQSTCIMVKGNELMIYFIYWPLFVQSIIRELNMRLTATKIHTFLFSRKSVKYQRTLKFNNAISGLSTRN